ncbi:MAG: hypothetical protein UV67_C0001G0034 [Parcubacteria group bacterium GW2011_GWC1_43_12]|nr:MAG: hypothetical protein UV34_C0011G0012 [Parcubacteria group bacterium GW2011_GWB1_42_6]KKS92594.1 MAG: hypothetical protein UV67_C0001G0034 [Parcubacteria group bacterium GW2011_GWC1_43_12]
MRMIFSSFLEDAGAREFILPKDRPLPPLKGSVFSDWYAGKRIEFKVDFVCEALREEVGETNVMIKVIDPDRNHSQEFLKEYFEAVWFPYYEGIDRIKKWIFGKTNELPRKKRVVL